MKKLPTRFGLAAVATLCLSASAAGQLSDERFRFTTAEKLDATQTSAYAGSHHVYNISNHESNRPAL